MVSLPTLSTSGKWMKVKAKSPQGFKNQHVSVCAIYFMTLVLNNFSKKTSFTWVKMVNLPVLKGSIVKLWSCVKENLFEFLWTNLDFSVLFWQSKTANDLFKQDQEQSGSQPSQNKTNFKTIYVHSSSLIIFSCFFTLTFEVLIWEEKTCKIWTTWQAAILLRQTILCSFQKLCELHMNNSEPFAFHVLNLHFSVA